MKSHCRKSILDTLYLWVPATNLPGSSSAPEPGAGKWGGGGAGNKPGRSFGFNPLQGSWRTQSFYIVLETRGWKAADYVPHTYLYILLSRHQAERGHKSPSGNASAGTRDETSETYIRDVGSLKLRRKPAYFAVRFVLSLGQVATTSAGAFIRLPEMALKEISLGSFTSTWPSRKVRSCVSGSNGSQTGDMLAVYSTRG